MGDRSVGRRRSGAIQYPTSQPWHLGNAGSCLEPIESEPANLKGMAVSSSFTLRGVPCEPDALHELNSRPLKAGSSSPRRGASRFIQIGTNDERGISIVSG